MTKYILHGGYVGAINEDNDNFFREFVVGLDKEINILLCYFAKKEELKENEKFQRDSKRIYDVNNNKKINCIFADRKNFSNQVKNADVIYFGGGSTFLLLEELKTIKNLEKLFKNKVIAGSSAGAYVFCKYFYENDDDKLGRGLGILDLKCFCHFDESKLKLVEKLRNYKEKDLEILTLPEFKYQIIYK